MFFLFAKLFLVSSFAATRVLWDAVLCCLYATVGNCSFDPGTRDIIGKYPERRKVRIGYDGRRNVDNTKIVIISLFRHLRDL